MEQSLCPWVQQSPSAAAISAWGLEEHLPPFPFHQVWHVGGYKTSVNEDPQALSSRFLGPASPAWVCGGPSVRCRGRCYLPVPQATSFTQEVFEKKGRNGRTERAFKYKISTGCSPEMLNKLFLAPLTGQNLFASWSWWKLMGEKGNEAD